MDLEKIIKSSVEESDALNAGMVQNLADKDGKLLSPIDLTMDILKAVKLPKLAWKNLSLYPNKMKLTNTGHTVILSAKWSQKRPHINGGPLLTNYVFSQVHFHWGANEQEGSEHTSNGISYPMEMHVVFFKSAYLTQEAALKQDDGVVVLAYFFKLIDSGNPSLDVITTALPAIKEARTSAHIQLVPLSFFMEEFTDDYILYWGGVQTHSCIHTILWIISRQALGVSMEQLAAFRELEDSKSLKLMRNFRDPYPIDSRSVFHANPSSDTSQLLLPEIRQTKRSTIPVMVNYNYSNVINLPKYFSKRDKLKTKHTKSKQCINNIFNTDKLIFMGSTDLEKEVEKNILKILTQLKSEDKLLNFENVSENVNSQVKQNEESDKNKKVKSSLGVQKKNTHETNIMKLKEAIMYLKNKDKTGNDENVIVNELDKSVQSIKDIKQIEELNMKDKLVTLCSNNNYEYKPKMNKYFKTVYTTKSTRIKIATDRKQFEKRRKIERLKEKRQKMINSKTNLKAKIYNKKNIRNFNKPTKSLFEQYKTVKNDQTKEKQHIMFTDYIGENDMNTKVNNGIEEKLAKKMHGTNSIFYEMSLLQSNDDFLCNFESKAFQDKPINTPLFNTNLPNFFQSYTQSNVLESKKKFTNLNERNVENKKSKEENFTRNCRSPSPLNKNIDRLNKTRTRSASPRISYTGELQSNIDKKYKGAFNNDVLNYRSCLPTLSINRREFSVKNTNLNRVCEKRANLKCRCDSHRSSKKDVNVFTVTRDCDNLNNEEIKRRSLLLRKYRVNNRKELVTICGNEGEEKENFRSISQKLNKINRKTVKNIDIKTMKETTINIDKENSENISNSPIELNTRNRDHSITNIEKTAKENTISINNENSESRSNSIELNTRNRQYMVENIDKKTAKENTINVERVNSESRPNSLIKLNARKKKYLVTSIGKKCEENCNNNRLTSPYKYKGCVRKEVLTTEDKIKGKSISNTSSICNLNDVITSEENTSDKLIIRYNSSERCSLMKRKEFVTKDDDIYNKVLKNEHNKGSPNSDTYSLTNSTELSNKKQETCDEKSNVLLTPADTCVIDRQKLVNNLEEKPGSLKFISDITPKFNEMESVGNLVNTYKTSQNSTPHVNNGNEVLRNPEREEEKEWHEISNLNNLSIKCDKTHKLDLGNQERDNTNKDSFLCTTKIFIIFDEQDQINLVTNEDKKLGEDGNALNLKYNTQILESVDFDMKKDSIQENIHKESTNLLKNCSEEFDLQTMIDKQIKENPMIQLLMKKTLDYLNVSGETDLESSNFNLHRTNNKTNLENTCEVNSNKKLENLGNPVYDLKDKLKANDDNTNKEISNPDKFITKINVETNEEGDKIKSVNSTITLTKTQEYFNDVLNNTEIVKTQIKENIPESNDCMEHFIDKPTKHAYIEIINENLMRNQIVTKGTCNDLIYSDERHQFANNDILSHNEQVDEIFQQNLTMYKLNSVPLQDYIRDSSNSQTHLLKCSEPSDNFIEQFKIKQQINSPEKSYNIDGRQMLEDKFNDSKSNSLKQQPITLYKMNYLSNDSVNVKELMKQKTHIKNTNKIIEIEGNTVRCRSVSPRKNYLNNDNIINNKSDNVNEDNEYYHQNSFKSSYGNSNKINNNNHVIKEYEEKECVQIIRPRSNSPKKSNVVSYQVRSSGSLEHATPNNNFNMDKTALKCTENTSNSLSRPCSPETKRRIISLKNPNDSCTIKKAERSLYTNTTYKRRNSVLNKFDVTSSELSSKTVSCEDKLPVSSFSSAVSYNSFQYEMNKRKSRVDDFASQNTEYVSSTVGYSTETDTMKATNTSMTYSNSTKSGQNPYTDNIVSTTMEEKTNCEITFENKNICSEVETHKVENGEKLNDLEIKTNGKKNMLNQKANKQMEDGKILSNKKLKSKETLKNETRLKVVNKNLPKAKVNTLKSSLTLRNMKMNDGTNGSKILNIHQSSDNLDKIKIEQNNSSSSKVTSQISKRHPDRKTILNQNNKPKFPYLKRQSKTFKPDNSFIEQIKIKLKQREMLSNRVEPNVDQIREEKTDIDNLNKNSVLKNVPTNSGDNNNNNKKKFKNLKSRSKSSNTNTKLIPEKKTPPRNRSTSPSLKPHPKLKLTQELLDNKNEAEYTNLEKEHSLIQNSAHNAQIEVVTFQPVTTLLRKGTTHPSTAIVYKRIQSPQNILKLSTASRNSTTTKQFSSNQFDSCDPLTDSTYLENENKLTAKEMKKLTSDNKQNQFQSKIPILRNRLAETKI